MAGYGGGVMVLAFRGDSGAPGSSRRAVKVHGISPARDSSSSRGTAVLQYRRLCPAPHLLGVDGTGPVQPQSHIHELGAFQCRDFRQGNPGSLVGASTLLVAQGSAGQ